ncbi:MAG: polysaccharide pyruvyl transferase family protein [Acidobacteriia bacterium]|nr:polysaccharide pyruvyl transferase family protein [Terriglobia bacterium]
MNETTRRSFLAAALSGVSCAASCSAQRPPAPVKKIPTILLRSGWQTENIGDIAHTPGVLRLLTQHFSEVNLVLWSNATDRGVGEMLMRNFPALRIVSGEPGDQAIREAFSKADFLLHGSGPSVVARNHVEAWRKATGKPYGILGVTITAKDEAASKAIDERLRDLLENASFVYTRESQSLANLKSAGVKRTRLGLAPDGAFSLKLSDDVSAKTFLEKNGLEQKKFIAAIPRLRYTPYHLFKKNNQQPPAEIARRTAVNEKHQHEDHAKMREAMIAWVRNTGGKVLLCPEMTYQVDLLDPLLYNPLPDDVKKKVVRRKTYWITDEASSVYRRAFAVLSFECHSPIIAATGDTPGMYIRQPEDGIKGQMWTDVGLAHCALPVEQTTGAEIARRLMRMHADYASAQVTVHEAVIYARRLQSDAMDLLKTVLA